MKENSLPLRSLDANPYLSIVAASRNDDHGGDPLIRTQIFINNFARQCERYSLPAELIIVDWNPVPGRPGLAAVLELPSETTLLRARVITVPAALHLRLKYALQLPLFQMIAKNVGIRRARGTFVLATNIDIIFSNELIQLIAQQDLDPTKLYRVDRYDIQNGLSKDLSLDDTLEYAWANPIRANRRYQPERLVEHLYGDEVFRKVCAPAPAFHGRFEGVDVVGHGAVWEIRPERGIPMTHMHTNACGDFTLLSRAGWEAIRGYPEFASYSFNIDSMGVLAAHYGGYQEAALLPPAVCFHIEHSVGSGWSPEGEKKLFDRLREAAILSPEWPVLFPLVEEMREQGKPLEFNHSRWGMADFDLPEQAMGDQREIPAEKIAQLALQAVNREVSAIQPDYDLDRLTLAHERFIAGTPRSETMPSPPTHELMTIRLSRMFSRFHRRLQQRFHGTDFGFFRPLIPISRRLHRYLTRLWVSFRRRIGRIVEKTFLRGSRDLTLKVDNLRWRVATSAQLTSALEPMLSQIDSIAADVRRLTDQLEAQELRHEMRVSAVERAIRETLQPTIARLDGLRKELEAARSPSSRQSDKEGRAVASVPK